jgi:predicted AAA+ superfamily ATPase
MFESVLVDQNPHWDGAVYPEGVPRQVQDGVKQHLDLPHILSFIGVRRAGKSTLMRQMINHLIRERGVPPRNILFCNLEMPVLNRYRNDVANLDRIYEDYLKLAAPQGRVFVFLDEVQFFPDWQVFVKSPYEGGDIKFMVTASNSRLISSEFMTLLSGRTLPVEVMPFSFGEFLLARNAFEIIVDPLEGRRRHHEAMETWVKNQDPPPFANWRRVHIIPSTL